MPAKREGREDGTVKAAKDEFAKDGWLVAKTQAGGYGGVVGQADLICAAPGRDHALYIAVECKRPDRTNHASEKQLQYGRRVLRAGGIWRVVYDRADARALVEDVKKYRSGQLDRVPSSLDA